MKILMIGHRGYVGPVAARHLARALPGAELHGLDANWFQGSEAAPFPDGVAAVLHVRWIGVPVGP